MTTYTKTWTNYVWLAWFTIQVPIITLVDGYDHLFPAWLHEAPGSPLNALAIFRQWYIDEFNDPIVQWSPDKATGHDSWIGLFMHIEFLFTLPIVLYAVYRLGIQRKGTSGADELLLLVYGFETALTTLVCLYDVSYWNDSLYPTELKNVFRFQFYGPWMLIPTLIFIDMAWRILKRINSADAAIAGKKGQ